MATTTSTDRTVADRVDKPPTGYIHVYTGDGKGKTTAAMGLALRALGAGWPVFIGQFAKSGQYSEISALKKWNEQVTVRQFGTGEFIIDGPDTSDIVQAREGLATAREILKSGKYRLVILDEINCAAGLGLISVDEILELIDEKPDEVELVLTGRWADPQVVRRADLVTEMHEVKHYYHKGVVAREGVEQ